MMKPTISLCMIVKNEQEDLPKCLESVKDLVDEMVIVDTGSADKTKEIAESFGAKVFDFKWSDDFSAARNESLKQATGDWILILDADEMLLENEKEKVKGLVEKKDIEGFVFFKKNYFGDSSLMGWKGEWFPSSKVLLFQNNKGIQFQGTVHEMVEDTIQGKIERSNVHIEHYIKNVEDKKKYYLELTEKKIKENPTPKAYIEAGLHYKDVEKFDKAVEMFEKVIQWDKKEIKIQDLSYAYFCLGIIYFKKNNLEKAAENFERAAEIDPMNHEAYNNWGAMHDRLGNYRKAKEVLIKGVKINPKNAKGYYNLGVICEKEGILKGAIKAFEKAVELDYFRKQELVGKIKRMKEVLNNK